MSAMELYVAGLDEGHRELAIALEGLSDEDLWRRAHPRLLSVGELAGHVAFGQSVWATNVGGNAELPELSAVSPLVDVKFRYYPDQIQGPVTLRLGTDDVGAELAKVHSAVREILLSKQATEPYPGGWGTWGNMVQYQVFHIAYHTGQIYSVRHLMGHKTVDN